MFKCPAITQVEHDTIGQTDARFRRVARSLGLEVCGFMTFDKFFNRKYLAPGGISWKHQTKGDNYGYFHQQKEIHHP